MPEKRAHDILTKHGINLEDVREGKTTLHHLRNIVRSEQLPFDVFHALVRLRR